MREEKKCFRSVTNTEEEEMEGLLRWKKDFARDQEARLSPNHRSVLNLFRVLVATCAIIGIVKGVSRCVDAFSAASLIRSGKALGGILPSSEVVSGVGKKNSTQLERNLVYVKIPKTGSTTVAFIAKQIAELHGIHGFDFDFDNSPWITDGKNEEPGVWCDHSDYRILEPKVAALQMDTFKFTFLREPTRRIMSEFQFLVMDKVQADNNFECLHRGPNSIFTKSEKNRGVNACRLPRPSTENEIRDRLKEYIEETCSDCEHDYIKTKDGKANALDFIGITERFNESLIVLKEMLGLDYASILYLYANDTPQDWDGKGSKELPQGFVDMVKGMLSESKDFALYERANRDLDDKIASISDFQEKKDAFEEMLQRARDTCDSPNLRAHFTWNWTYIEHYYTPVMRCLDHLRRKPSFIS
jgi:hypothetical protein